MDMHEKTKKQAACRMGKEAVPPAGYGIGGRRKAGSQEQMGSDLAITAGQPTGGCCG